MGKVSLHLILLFPFKRILKINTVIIANCLFLLTLIWALNEKKKCSNRCRISLMSTWFSDKYVLEIYVQPAAKIGNQHDFEGTLRWIWIQKSLGFFCLNKDFSNDVLFYVCTKFMKINHNAYKSENMSILKISRLHN